MSVPFAGPPNRQRHPADRNNGGDGGGDGRPLGRRDRAAAKDGLDLRRDLRAVRVYSTSQRRPTKQPPRSSSSSSRAEQIMELKRQLASTRQDLQFSKVSTRQLNCAVCRKQPLTKSQPCLEKFFIGLVNSHSHIKLK